MPSKSIAFHKSNPDRHICRGYGAINNSPEDAAIMQTKGFFVMLARDEQGLRHKYFDPMCDGCKVEIAKLSELLREGAKQPWQAQV
jgi:hypothetical protein